MLCYVCYVMLCVLRPTNIGCVQCFSLGSLLSLYAYVSRFVMRFVIASKTSGLCSACTSVPFGILHACVFMFCVLPPCKHRVFAMLFPSAPFKFVRLCLSRFVMRTLPHKHRVCAVLFSRFPFKMFVRLFLSRFVMRTLPRKHRTGL